MPIIFSIFTVFFTFGIFKALSKWTYNAKYYFLINSIKKVTYFFLLENVDVLPVFNFLVFLAPCGPSASLL